MRVCPYCFAEFSPTHGRQRYCGRLCLNRAKSERQSLTPSRRAYVRAWKRKRIASEVQEANAKKANRTKNGSKAAGGLGMPKLHKAPALEVQQLGVRVPEMRAGCSV